MSALINEPGRLPSQTIQNPKGNINAVTLRSGRKLAIKPMEQEEDESPRMPGEEQMRPEALGTLEQDTTEKMRKRPRKSGTQLKKKGTYPKSTRSARYPEPKPPKSAQHFHFQYQLVCKNNMSWMRTCLSCLTKLKSTSPSWKPSSKFLDMLSF
ncbi:unnamed protein product [Rhodiola kirilowii]